jgi:hypothetical protein
VIALQYIKNLSTINPFTYEDFSARTEVKTQSFDSEAENKNVQKPRKGCKLSLYMSLMQVADTFISTPHSQYRPDIGEFTVNCLMYREFKSHNKI